MINIKKRLKKLIRKTYNLFYSIPFGMEAANDNIMGSINPSDDNKISINQNINQKRVAKDLLKGEVTETVSELRYRTYLVEKESKKYRYIGNGNAVKIDEKDIKTKINFIQPNFEIVGSVIDELERINDYGKRRFVLNIDYENKNNRFKIEEYIKSATVYENDGILYIIFSYSKYYDQYDMKSKIFINSLEDALNGKINMNDSVPLINKLSFITNKVNGEDDYIRYIFFNLSVSKIELDNKEYRVTYICDSYTKNNLLNDYYNHEMDKKYKNHESKHRNFNILDNNDIDFHYKCEDCGKEISNFEANETKEAVNRILCLSCLEKYINIQNE